MVKEKLTVIKVVENISQVTGLNVKVVSDGIKISMKDYSRSLKDIMEIRKPEDRMELPAKLEMEPFRKRTGQIAWLANSTRPDLCYLAPQMSKKNQKKNRGSVEEPLSRNWVLYNPR